MMFLLNDAVIMTDCVSPPINSVRFRALSMDFVLKLGAETYAERPLLHKTDPAIAQRLVSLIMAKAPEANAALFVAPALNCRPEQVLTRVATLSIDIMADLYRRQNQNALNTVVADSIVWRRMAA
jgi:hypothetical protein